MRGLPGSLKVAVGAGVGFLCGVLLIVVLALSGGSDSAAPTTSTRAAPVAGIEVPNVVGLRLDVARDQIEGEGLEVERSGGGLFGVVVESNWQVESQTPRAGARIARGATVELLVDRP
ncbi:MAG TPA: PASTA domain-containing protein [Conexibacter sp.]|nr:PASTA domain-containing protein [Conexibacter sp.]